MLHTAVHTPLIKHLALLPQPRFVGVSVNTIASTLLLSQRQINVDLSVRMSLKPAAVLIGLVEQKDKTYVLLTKRTAHLSKHAGQIAFPGGRVDPSDQNIIATALRETQEEIGILSKYIQVFGQLEPLCTRTGYWVTPIVGKITNLRDLRPNPDEVDEVFTVPVDHFLNPNHYLKHRHRSNPYPERFISVPWNGQFIWGVTASLLYNFYVHLMRQQIN